MSRIGLNIRDMPAKDAIDCAKLADEKGVESVWINESAARNATSLLAAAAITTQKIRLATGISSIYLRSPTLTAMTMGTIDELSGGRTIIGLGVSSPPMAKIHNMTFEKPFTRMKEYIEILKKAFTGEAFTYEGRIFNLRNWKLGFKPPREHIPIYIAAHNPQMLQLAGEHADGVLLNIISPEEAKRAVENLHIGIKRSGRSPEDVDVASYITTCISDNEEEAKEVARRALATSASSAFVNRRLSRSPFAEEAAAIKKATDAGDRQAAVNSVTDRMIEGLSITGSPRELKGKVERYVTAGVELPILGIYPVGGTGRENFQRTIDAI